MKKNVGYLDRMFRILLAEVFILLAAFVFDGVLSVVFYVVSILLLVTAAVGFCGLYQWFGISTVEKKHPLVWVTAVFIVLFVAVLLVGL